MTKHPWIPFIYLLLLAGAGFLIYSNTLDSPFVFDAKSYILDDTAIRMTDFSWEQVKTAAFESVPKKRFLDNLSFAFNYYFDQYDVFGYHLVNIAIHVLCAICLLFFVKTTLARTPAGRSELPAGMAPGTVALLTALLWLAYPIHTGAVTYIVQRMTSLAVMFFILCLWLYVLGRLAWQAHGLSRRSIALFAGCMLAGLCAFATKQNTATLPIVILIYEFFFFQDLKVNITRRQALWLAGGTLVFAAIALFYLGENPLDRILSSYTRREFTLGERVMTEWRIIIYYISLFFWPAPWRLNLDYDYPLSYHLTNPSVTLVALLAILGMLLLVIFIARRHRIIAFCMLWFFVNLAIESSVIGIELIYEHRTYLPFMMLCLMAVILIGKIASRPKIPIAVLCIIILGFSVWTFQRNQIWQNPITFWMDGIKKSPLDVRPYANIGYQHMKNGRYKAAIPYYESALNRWMNQGGIIEGDKLSFQTGLAFMQTGQPEKAISYFRKAVDLNPEHLKAHYHLAGLLHKKGNNTKAIAHYKRVIEIEPDHVKAHNSLGNVFAQQGQFNEAIAHFKKVVQIHPDYESAYLNLGNALARIGRFQEAINNYEQVLAINPHHKNARQNLEKVKEYMERKK